MYTICGKQQCGKWECRSAHPTFPTASNFPTKTSTYSMDSTLKENVSTMYVPWLVPMLSDGCPAALRNSQVQTLQS